MNADLPDEIVAKPSKPNLDALDLRELRENGRISMAVRADRVNLSLGSADNRVELLTRAGVITGFSAGIDPRLVDSISARIVRHRAPADVEVVPRGPQRDARRRVLLHHHG
jgi:DNA-binding Lrp family transcriptional regulator